MHFKFEHDFDIDPNGFWEMFFDEAYNVELYRHLRTKERKVLEQKEEGGVLRRTAKVTPERDIPSLFKSFVSDMSYTERDVFERAKSEMKVAIEPGMMRDRLQMGGLFSVRPAGAGCRRTFEGDVKISVPLIGGKMEKFMIDEIRTSYDQAAEATRGWIARKKQA